MIFDKLIEFILSPVTWLINVIPSPNITIPVDVFSNMGDVFGAIGYIVPWKGLLPIFTISFSIVGFRILWAIILRIKSFIPTLGGT